MKMLLLMCDTGYNICWPPLLTSLPSFAATSSGADAAATSSSNAAASTLVSEKRCVNNSRGQVGG